MKKYALMLITFFSFYFSYGQGCSDAGFCTMGALRPSQVYTRKINFKLRTLEFNQYRGATTLTPIVNVSTLDFTFGINEKTSFQIKLPYQWVNGVLGKTAGVGDISYSFTHNVASTENYHINATLGGKIPSNNADLGGNPEEKYITPKPGEAPDLPMYYQISLGTWDIIAGASIVSKKWMMAVGIQVPVIHNNKNDFRYEAWSQYPGKGYLWKHPLATNLKRGTDMMLRIERAFHFSNLDIRLGLLPIFRISKDEILNRSTGKREKMAGTTGMALSGILGISYHFNVYNSLKFHFGYNLTYRDHNPDGLTRHDVASLAYVIKF